jgi:hypothetical protein
LEFQHHYATRIVGNSIEVRVEGTVPLSISGEEGTVNGMGMLNFTYSGNFPQGIGTASGEGTLKAVIGGKLEKDKSSGKPVLKLDIDESWEVQAIVTYKYPFFSFTQPSQYTPRHDRGYPFPMMNGDTMEVKGPLPPGQEGGPKIILHLKKK